MKTKTFIKTVLILVAIWMTSNFFNNWKDVQAMDSIMDIFRSKITGYTQANQDRDDEQNEKDKQEIIRLSEDILERFKKVWIYECIQRQKGVREWCNQPSDATMDNVLDFVYDIEVVPDFQ